MSNNKLLYTTLLTLAFIASFSFYYSQISHRIKITESLYQEDIGLHYENNNNPLTLNRMYKEMERYPTNDYTAYILEYCDDFYIQNFTMSLTENCNNNIECIEKISEYVFGNISYQSEKVEYPKFPIETLVEKNGDCEDLAILGASMTYAIGIDSYLVLEDNHMVYAVDIGNGIQFIERGFSFGKYESNYIHLDRVENKPIFYHKWGDIILENKLFQKKMSGNITVSNIGTRTGVVSLHINNHTKNITIEPYRTVTIDFEIPESYLETKLFYKGELIEEKKEKEKNDED